MEAEQGNPEPTTETPQGETQEQAWNRIVEKAPITKEAVQKGGPEAPKEGPRTYAPKLAEFVKAQSKPEPNPLEERLARIEQYLAPKEEPQQPDVTQELMALRQELARREQEALEAQAKAEFDAQMSVHKEGVIGSLRASNEYPGLVALGQEEAVFDTLLSRLEQGESVSEDDIAREAERKLKDIFQKLSEVYRPVSKDPVPEPKPSTNTITPDMSSADVPVDKDGLIKELGMKDAQAALWDKMFNQG